MSGGVFVIGLTGSIGMGKSTVAEMFREAGCHIIDSDQATHALLGFGGEAVSEVLQLCPEAEMRDGERIGVDREILSACLRDQDDLLPRLEAILHPMIAAERYRTIDELRALSEGDGEFRIVVVDIPLLFEKNLQSECDYVVVVSAPMEVQRQRVLARPGMTEEKLNYILSKQMSDEGKRGLADLVLDSSKSLQDTKKEVKKLLDEIRP